MENKSNKGIIICLVVIILLLIGIIAYLLFGKDNNKVLNGASSTTITTPTQKESNLKIIKVHEEQSEIFAKCIKESSGLEETCKSFNNPDEIKINYPVIEGNTNTIKTINNKILKDVNELIKNAENNKDVNDESNSCDNIQIIETGKTNRYEHFETLSFNVMSEEGRYISIIEMTDVHSSCASGWFEIDNIYIYDKEAHKEITQDELKKLLTQNDLDNLYNKIETDKKSYNETDGLDIIKKAIYNIYIMMKLEILL